MAYDGGGPAGGLWRPADIASALRQPRTLAERGHRPWPLPGRPWMMGQSWENLLFAHWRVDAAKLRSRMPVEISLDTFDGSAWIGITPFMVTGSRARFMPPLPGCARFPEVNVRTYATVDGRPGIYFISLDTPNQAAVAAARRVYRLPYFRSRIDIGVRYGSLVYRSQRTDRHGLPAALEAHYRPSGPAAWPARHSFEWWATERYCLYTLDEHQRVLRGDIHHPPWALHRPRRPSLTTRWPCNLESSSRPTRLFTSPGGRTWCSG